VQTITTENRGSGSAILGVVLIILGVVAIMAPLFAAVVLIRVIAWLLIFAAVEQVIYAFRTRTGGGLFLKVVLALLYAVAGVMLLSRPAHGAIAATAVIGFLLIADGVAEIVLGFEVRRTFGRTGWIFAGGILSLCLGALIVYRLPWSMVAVGWLVGIRLLFKGIEHIMRPSAGTRAPDIESRAA